MSTESSEKLSGKYTEVSKLRTGKLVVRIQGSNFEAAPEVRDLIAHICGFLVKDEPLVT